MVVVGGSIPLVAIMFPNSKSIYNALLAGKIGSIPFAPIILIREYSIMVMYRRFMETAKVGMPEWSKGSR